MAYVILIGFQCCQSFGRIRVEQEFDEDFGCTLVGNEGPLR